MVAAWASRNAENTQVRSAKPPSLLTIDGVAVATMLISIAVRNIASITEAVMTRRPRAGVTAAGAVAGPAAAPGAPQHFMLRSGEGEATETLGRTNARDAFLIAPHGQTITHLDAPSHTFVRADASAPWTMYNGKPRALVRTVDGATAGSIELV